MKKFLSLLLVAAMLLTLAPTVMFAADVEATQKVKLFDAHITGNVVIGGTLTANFSPSLDDADIANLCPGLDVEKTKASIQWYAKNRYGYRSSGTYTLNNDGNLTYTVPETYKTSNNPAIFFKITPKNADGEAIGDTVYSTISYMPQAINATVTAPIAKNAHISPLNGDGILDVGQSVAARYTFIYQKSASIGEMKSKYTWFTSDELLSNDEIETKATLVQNESTSPYYAIKAPDAGKWLYAKIIAVASDGAEATSAVYTKNHLGNGFLPNSNSLTGHSVSKTSNNSLNGFNSQASYPAVKLVADGCAPISNTHAPSTFVQAYNNTINAERTLIVDAGKVVSFDGIYLAHGYATIGKIIISYSNDNQNWTDVVVNSSCTLPAPGEKDFLFDNVLSAQYFKLLVKNSNSGTLNIDEFYPFLRNTTSIDFTKSSFAQLNGSEIEVQAWGTPLNEVKKAENGFLVNSKLDVAGETANADAIANSAVFVTKAVTTDGDVYTEVANPENIKVTENLENTYLKIDDGKKIQYYLVKYAGHIGQTEDEVITSASGTTGTDIQLMGGSVALKHHDAAGNAIGKYLLKTQLKIPARDTTTEGKGIRTIINAHQGSFTQKGATIGNILLLNGWYTQTTVNSEDYLSNEIGVPAVRSHSGYNLMVNKWLDVEILFDFDSTTKGNVAEGEDETINITTWVDGKLIANTVQTWKNPLTISDTSTASASILTPYLAMVSNQAIDIVQRKNSSFRQVWSADTHVVENDYSLKIVNTNDTANEAANLTAGNYTANTKINIHKGDYPYTYIAKYYVNGDVKELIEVETVSNIATDFITVTEKELSENTVELKAITMSALGDAYYPQFVSKSLEEN